MNTRVLKQNGLGRDEDWVGNNVAVACPSCGKIYLTSGMIHRGHRICPICGGSTVTVTPKGDRASVEWSVSSEPAHPRVSTEKLLSQYAAIMKELARRAVVRTANNPVADYAEWLVSSKWCLQLMNNSAEGYDAVDSKGKRYQIKSRRMIGGRISGQLGVIRNLDKKPFDELIVVYFNEDFTVKSAFQVSHDEVLRRATFSNHQNGHILSLSPNNLNVDGVKDITATLD